MVTRLHSDIEQVLDCLMFLPCDLELLCLKGLVRLDEENGHKPPLDRLKLVLEICDAALILLGPLLVVLNEGLIQLALALYCGEDAQEDGAEEDGDEPAAFFLPVLDFALFDTRFLPYQVIRQVLIALDIAARSQSWALLLCAP